MLTTQLIDKTELEYQEYCRRNGFGFEGETIKDRDLNHYRPAKDCLGSLLSEADRIVFGIPRKVEEDMEKGRKYMESRRGN